MSRLKSVADEVIMDNFVQKQKDYIDNLSEVDKRIVSLYTHNGDIIINKFIRNNFQLNDNIIDYYNNHELLHSLCLLESKEVNDSKEQLTNCLFYFYTKLQFLILNAPKTPCDITVYRGANSNRIIPDSLVFMNQGFFSTSLLKEVAYGFATKDTSIILHITIPKNKRCLFLFLKSVYPAEFEVLMPNRNIFNVYERRENTTLVLQIQEDSNQISEYKSNLIDLESNDTTYTINDLIETPSVFYKAEFYTIRSLRDINLIKKYINKHKIRHVYVSTRQLLTFLNDCPSVKELTLNNNIKYTIPDFKYIEEVHYYDESIF